MNKVGVHWIVQDVALSIEFYKEKLGFSVDWVGDGPLFAIVSRGNFSVMLRRLEHGQSLPRPNRIPFVEFGWHSKTGVEAWDAYVWVDDADALYDEFQKAGVSIIKPIIDAEYGNRDFEIEDCNGYILCFGHSKK